MKRTKSEPEKAVLRRTPLVSLYAGEGGLGRKVGLKVGQASIVADRVEQDQWLGARVWRRLLRQYWRRSSIRAAARRREPGGG
jgi:hypothetical protein